MGIENFYNTLIKNKIINKKYLDNNNIECDYLYIDFNSIVHLIVDNFEYDINYYLYSLIISDKDEYIKNIEKEYNIKYDKLDEFLNYFTQENVDEFIKDKIYDFLKKICLKIGSNGKLKEIFISFDGTPTFSKISEQRKKKYVNTILNEFKDEIYNKNKELFDENRKTFEENKIRFGKNQSNKYCGNWTGHIQDIYNNISSFHFKMEIHEICPNLKDFIVSSAYEFGEGEKKITEHILQYKKSGNYVIFSPDSDTVLLSIMMSNKLNRLNIQNDFKILKKTDDKIEIIYVNEVIDNLYNLLVSKLNPYRKLNHDKLNILDDLIGLFTFFGNDFLPRIESLNIRNGLEVLCTIYARNLSFCRSKYPYLLFIENNITKLNINVFIELINKITESEDKLLFDKYMSTEFKNFNYLLNIFGFNEYTPFFIDKLNRYSHGFNKLVRYIKMNPDKTSNEIYINIIEKFSDKTEWKRIFMEIENKDKIYGEICVIDMLEIIMNHIKENKKYKLGLKLIRNTENIFDRYHQNNIQENMSHPKIAISSYDIDIYKFDKKIDQYQNISLEIDEKIGLVDLKYKDNEYKIHTDRNIIIKKDFFYANILQLKENEINLFIEEYLRGFLWVIDFYFNKTNRLVNINNISIWSYTYTHSPYFKEISKYLTSTSNIFGVFTKLFRNISDINGDYYVSSSHYINTFEQYLYITPKHILKNNVPEIYKDILVDEIIFTNIDPFYEKIKNGEKNLIETYDVKSLNKANIIGFRKPLYIDFMEKIIFLRTLNEIA